MGKNESRKNQIHDQGRYLVYLLSCALNNASVDYFDDTVSWKQIYRLAKMNNVEATVWQSVKALKDKIPDDLYNEWKLSANRTLFRQLQFDEEREQILVSLEQNKITYIPLKGIKIAQYYPKPGMRFMCDNDILYGYVDQMEDGTYQICRKNAIEDARNVVSDIMRDRGYTLERFEGLDFSCQKKPLFNFEMHRGLFKQSTPYYEYYKNPWKRSFPVKEGEYEFQFSKEDEYIYILCHTHKHFSSAGCGIRSLVDEYVICKNTSLNWDYIHDELKILNLDEFEQQFRNTAIHAFDPDEKMNAQDYDLIDYMLGSGTYGRFDQNVTNQLDKIYDKNHSFKAKILYLHKRIWLCEDDMQARYPFFYHHKCFRFLLPFVRLIKGIVIHPAQLVKELHIFTHYKARSGSR